MNYIVAILLFSANTYHTGYTTTTIDSVAADSIALSMGLEHGDEIISLNNSKITTYSDLMIGLSVVKDEAITVGINREGEQLSFAESIELNNESEVTLGISMITSENPGVFESIQEGFKRVISTVKQTFLSLKLMITGQVNFKSDVAGPITIIKMSAETAKKGIWSLMSFTALLSTNLAVMNLLPIPALDGGWSVLILIELITRKKVPEKVVQVINTIGFVLLLTLMFIVIVKDILFPVSFN